MWVQGSPVFVSAAGEVLEAAQSGGQKAGSGAGGREASEQHFGKLEWRLLAGWLEGRLSLVC